MMRMLSNEERKRFFAAAVEKVRAAAEALSDAEIQSFSDLDEDHQRAFQKIWLTLSEPSRIYLFRRLNEAFRTNDLFDFSPLIRAGLDDPEGSVRFLALSLIPADGGGSFLRQLTELVHDRNEDVRVTAIHALGRYIGERAATRRVQPRVSEAIAALASIQGEARGRTAWALMEAFALAEDPAADAMISKAIHSTEAAGVASALRAVRYSLDDRWAENVLLLLDEDDPKILIEAIGAAGALRMKTAREPLMKLLLNFEKFGPEILAELILALANIGGSSTKNILNFLEEALADDSELIDILEEARDLFEIAEYERSLRSDSDSDASPESEDALASDDWVSDEDYLDQLALKIDLYLERNGLLTDEDDADADGDEFSSADSHEYFHDHFHDHADDETDFYGDDEADELSLLDADDGQEKRRTFMDWTDEEVAAFRAAHEGKDFDWEAFLSEADDEEI